MPTYFVTGATGFIGSRLVAGLLARADCELVYVLVREASKGKLAQRTHQWPNQSKVVPIVGDLGEQALGIDRETLSLVPDHFVHLAASYDIAATDEENDTANVVGTRNAIQFAWSLGQPTFHHVSSIAVAGDYDGVFTEADFDKGQGFPSPYHRTKFESEAMVRRCGLPYRVYRPSVVVGHSVTGAMDKVDGPYYSLPLIARLARLPKWLPLIAPDVGPVNFVPVDYVVSSMLALMHADVGNGSVHHLSSPQSDSYREYYNALARQLGSPQVARTFSLDLGRFVGPPRHPNARAGLLRRLANESLSEIGMPPELFGVMGLPVRFDSTETGRRLAALGIASSPPALGEYADVLVDYWKQNLDPDRVRRSDPKHPLRGKTVVITGASSGIGRALSLQVAALGAHPLMIARRSEELDAVRAEVHAAGGRATCYPCDLTDPEAVALIVKSILAEHGSIDFLVNNAGRSMRRSVQLSVDRFHDFERAMNINYFAVVRLTLAFLPSMIERQAGHIVNITTQAVDARPPRWGAYAASKAAADTFGMIAGADLLGDGIMVSNVRLPLVRTPMSAPSASTQRYLPTMSAETASQRYIVDRAMIGRKPVVDAAGGRFIGLNHMYNERVSRVINNLVAFQGMGETAPDGRDRNVRPPLVAATATAVGLVWRAMGRRQLD
jgi:NAD(P)-dependent dehydrogenase (short-subunit alcohol dehydrogenase family)